MTGKFIFRKAKIDDLEPIMDIIRQAQAQMAAAGSDQWQNGYPAASDILHDIERGYGYTLCSEEQVAAYGAVVFDGEEAYNSIEGAWQTAEPYAVVHRLAVADAVKRRGVAREFMHRTEELARQRDVAAFRIDTSFDNRPMLALLSSENFRYCGKIHYPSGERLAFEKHLNDKDS